MSVSDFSGRLLLPSTGRRHRPLSSSASTACWSMRFSLRMMTSGALRSTSFFKRLLRLMIRRYRSFRSLVAKLPLSSSTSGRRSGGITGITSMTIHSDLFSELRIASIIFKRLVRSLIFCLLLVFSIASRTRPCSVCRSSWPSSFLMASAPISAVGHLHAATVADDALVFRALVLAARTFPVPLRAEDALAEQAVLFGTVGTIVDRLGLLHLAERPRTNVVRACELNTNRAVVVN